MKHALGIAPRFSKSLRYLELHCQRVARSVREMKVSMKALSSSAGAAALGASITAIIQIDRTGVTRRDGRRRVATRQNPSNFTYERINLH